MVSEKSLWYRLGYALERSKQGGASARKTLAGLTERASDEAPADASDSERDWPAADELVSLGVAALVNEVLAVWRPGGRTPVTRLLRAGAAGAAAALLVDLVKPLLGREGNGAALDRDTGDRLLAGVGQGLLYGAVVEPRVPGPPLVKGALFGTVEYAADPAGGLARLLKSHTPHGRLPVVGDLLDGLDAHDRAYLEHVVFGVTLALLYGSDRSVNGAPREDDAD